MKDKFLTFINYIVDYFYLALYYSEVNIIKALKYCGYKQDASVIPKGVYCYAPDYDKISQSDDGYWIKPCRYYRRVTRDIKACTFKNFIGFDPCLWDQCKICSENLGFDDELEG